MIIKKNHKFNTPIKHNHPINAYPKLLENVNKLLFLHIPIKENKKIPLKKWIHLKFN